MSITCKTKGRFLNVDLDIESTSKSKLDALAREMGKRVSVLHCGLSRLPRRYVLSLESRDGGTRVKTPDDAIHTLCDLIEKLSPSGQRIWNSARREFNIGYEIRLGDLNSEFSIRPKTLMRIVELGAGLAVTHYQADLMKKPPRNL